MLNSCDQDNCYKLSSVSNGNLLTSFQRKLLLETLDKKNLSESYRQRIEIMLLADEGKTQTEICRVLGCCAATVRHWTHIARMGMAHQWQECPIGRPKAVNEEYLVRLKELVTSSPRDYGYSFCRWTAGWLQKHLAKELGIEISDRHIKRLLKQMGLSTVAKPNKTQEADRQPKILIKNLKSTKKPENSEFIAINFSILGKELDSVKATEYSLNTGTAR
jgi:transposase